jgi:phosphate starvation-inducible PhoH-like protein
MGKGAVECMLKNGGIEIVPFEVIRGRSWDEAFIVLDEAQNASRTEIKAFVTRIGEGSTTVINGDITQCDMPIEDSGLTYLVNLLKQKKNEELSSMVALVEFDWRDIVRSDLCRLWVKAFS